MSAVTYAEPPGPRPEIPPAGGDVTEGAVRIGDTARRRLGPDAPLREAGRERPAAALDAALTAP
ncbi:hypothetical protein BKM31_12025 [[Actinomadura] parvosata subsp. kistnae]|uniref:Uncharacterized protein n=1 Tax=[Actinomadura] parvosata subsp. kistnae TaxID=1909395 RepID=A0A1U9ZVX3_9ACTN|nr:hypothetical protein [Nonomuraea sp. ATCC 55076]AQZ62103.1 hypothetical protein BKM31_12025 [Nonomuraea sp. ATCC 55076]